MTNKVGAYTILLIMMALAGCGGSRAATLGLDVDLYLHPSSADPVDIILQTAIAKRLNDNAVTQLSLIHVRVENMTVILTGTAEAEIRVEAERIARQTELTLNGEAIRPRDPVTNRISTR